MRDTLRTKKEPVKCPRCGHEQTVEIYDRGRSGHVQTYAVCEGICKTPFDVVLPDEIVTGEFLPG
jgi:hypothetical protein